jgi:hypothetical protein
MVSYQVGALLEGDELRHTLGSHAAPAEKLLQTGIVAKSGVAAIRVRVSVRVHVCTVILKVSRARAKLHRSGDPEDPEAGRVTEAREPGAPCRQHWQLRVLRTILVRQPRLG